MKSVLLLTLLAILMPLGAIHASEAHVVEFEGAIGPVASAYISEAVARAERDGAVCLVVEMDTPGGLDTAMREIIQDILASKVPVIIYVHPAGARCASAGVFIAMSADAVGMTPGTSIGAAHPVTIGEGGVDDETMDKIVNDSASYIKSLAAKRGRSEEWAEQAVRESATATAEEALDLGITDVIADDVHDLLDQLDGLKVDDLGGGPLETAGVSIKRFQMGFRFRLLGILSNPNIAYMLLILGFYGIFFELSNPGSIFPGVLGAIFLVLAFYSFQMLPVSYAGAFLILLAMAFFVTEIWVTSGGLLTIGGVVAMLFGSLMLINSPLPFFKISLAVILPAVITTAAFFAFAVGAGLRAQRKKPVTGSEGLIGMRGNATTDIDLTGQAFIRGEIWTVRSAYRIEKGEEVEVVSMDGLKLLIKRPDSGTKS